jgi:hypothetical protein
LTPIHKTGKIILHNILIFTSVLTLMLSAFKDTTVVGAEEIECQNVSEVFNCLHVGMSNRQVGWITAQQPQYRSHCLFTLTLEQQWIVGEYRKII